MHRGASRREIFLTDKHRQKFLALLGDISKVYHVEIHCYCLMRNHYHLLLHTPEGNLSDAMQHLNSNYTRYFNHSQKSDGPLFRGRYKSLPISEEDYLLRLSRYIHQNPLKANIVSKLSAYRWSSYPAYIETAVVPGWLTLETVIRRFKKMRKKALSYKQFIELENDDELNKIHEKHKLAPVLGNQKFVEMIFNQLKDSSMSSEITNIKRVKNTPSIEEIIKKTAAYFSVPQTFVIKKIYHEQSLWHYVEKLLCTN